MGSAPRLAAALRVSFVVRIAIAVALSVCASTAALADAGLDAVVLLDRSTSMHRHLRTGALTLSMLFEVVARNAASTRLDHRIAVVTFGSSARVDVPFSPVRADTLPGLRRAVDALPAEDDRGDTDFLQAFAAAETLFRALPDDAARRRAILLVTDGVPFVRGADMAAYERKLRQVLAERRQSKIAIHVLLVGAASSAALWRDLADGVHFARSQADRVLAEGYGVMTQLVGTRTVESAPSKDDEHVDTLILPPYLDVAVFDVFRSAPDATVDVFPPGAGLPLRAGVAGVEAMSLGGVMATLIVPRPAPGRWTIRKSHFAARVRIVSQQFFPRGALMTPRAGDRLRQYDRVALVYGVTDDNGRPLVELPHYALSVKLSMAKPNGTVASVEMERASRQASVVFRAAHDTEFDLPGRYWTDVRISTVDDAGRRLDVFRDRWSGFTVVQAPRVAGCTGDLRIALVCIAAVTAAGAALTIFSLHRTTQR